MKSFVAVVTVAATAASFADAHVYLTQPLAEFKSGASKSSWVAEFQPPWEGTFKTGAQYAAVAPGKGFKDLKSFLDDKGPTCGNSLANASPKPIPSDGTIKLASTIEHPGPCEVWLDDVRAFQNEDCEKSFGSATSFKVDFSSCKGSCMLRFYWLGLQDGGKRWQSYKNCVPLSGGGGGGGGGTSKSNDAGDNTSNNSKNSNSKDTGNNSNNQNSNGGGSSNSKTTKAPNTKKPSSRSIENDYSFGDLEAWRDGNYTRD